MPSVAEPTLPPKQARAVSIVRDIHGPNRKTLWASFGDNFRQAVSVDKFDAISAAIDVRMGKLLEVKVLGQQDTGKVTTVHLAAFYERGTQRYRISLDEGGIVRGLLVAPFVEEDGPATGPADDYSSKRAYGLPCKGKWSVGNGGRDAKLNHHVGHRQQHYAFDLIRKGADGKSHSGDGKRNEDYLAWGQEVVAPADGTVVTVVDGVPDHGPDHTDRVFVPGNLVVIDHGDGEHSFLAHFQRGSIVVKPGARVKQGQLLGKVGNSGNSSEPHIHWHLASEADVTRGHGLPIRLAPLSLNGARAEAPAPVRDDTIEPLAGAKTAQPR
jgi:murein DD-endopeptidase MepM/ murein hydrolase activator NlpD